MLGEVTLPGQYPFQSGITVVSAVAAMGDFTYRAISDYAGVVRMVEGSALEGWAVSSPSMSDASDFFLPTVPDPSRAASRRPRLRTRG